MKGLEIRKNKVAVIGFGVSGKSVAEYFLKHGVPVDVYEDKKREDFDLESLHSFTQHKDFSIYFSTESAHNDMNQYDLVIASPGVPFSHPQIIRAQDASIECVTDINIFLRIFREQYPQGTVVSITGSNGKSTTVSWLYEALRVGTIDAYLGGNIGTSPLDFLDNIQTDTPVVVLETSSYQLEYITSFDYFDIACILNLSDNHLNRYGGKKELYAKAKLGGIHPTQTALLLNLDDQYTKQYIVPQLQTKNILGIQFESLNLDTGITFENDEILYQKARERISCIKKVSEIKLKGLHNVYNLAFVCGVLKILEVDIDEKIEGTIKDFFGLRHRVQYVDTIQNIVYINDSKSTSPDATIKALDTIGDQFKNIILISGGNDKDISYESMNESWTRLIKALVLLPGTANTKLKSLAEKTGVEIIGEVQTMQEAIDSIQSYAEEGDIVLLSPATDSHASFASFEDRGNQFIQCVQNLKN